MQQLVFSFLLLQAFAINWEDLNPPEIVEPIGGGKFTVATAFDDVSRNERIIFRCYGLPLFGPNPYSMSFPPIVMSQWTTEQFWSTNPYDRYVPDIGPITEVYYTEVEVPFEHRHNYTHTYDAKSENIFGIRCGAVAIKNETEFAFTVPLMTRPALVFTVNETEAHLNNECFGDLEIYLNSAKWVQNQGTYDWSAMDKKSGKLGGTSMGDYDGCQLITNAEYCSSTIPSVMWTGLCLPNSCDNSNVQKAYYYAAGSSIVDIIGAEVWAFQLNNTEVAEYMDEKIADALRIPVANVSNILDSLTQGAIIAIAGVSYSSFIDYATIWAVAQASRWWCGSTEKHPPIENAFWGVFASLMIIVVLATLYDMYYYYDTHQRNKTMVLNEGYDMAPNETKGEGSTGITSAADGPSGYKALGNDDLSDWWDPTNALEHIVVAFSLIRTWKIFMNNRGGELAFFDGIRVYACFWVILGHTEFYVLVTTWFANINTVYPSNGSADSTTFWWQIIPGAFFAVDTFFYLGGFFAAWIMAKKASRLRKKNIENGDPESKGVGQWFMSIPIIYLDRWLRLTPCVGVATLAYAVLLPNIGSGPLWPHANDDYLCEKGWWAEILYVTSWPEPPDQKAADWTCIGVTWYLTCDFFYFCITPFVVAVYVFVGEKMGMIACNVVILAFTINYLIYAQKYNLKANPFFQTDQGWNKTYGNPRVRGGPYFVGVFFGLLYTYLKKHMPNFKISGVISYSLQFIGFWIIFACVFGAYDTVKDATCTPNIPGCDYHDPWDQTTHTCYGVLTRVAFVVGLAMFNFSWIWGPKTSITRQFMTVPAFNQIGKLAFLMYLWHAFFLQWYYGTQPSPVYYSRLNMLIWWLGISFVAMVTALLFHLSLEIPAGTLLKLAPWNARKKKV